MFLPVAAVLVSQPVFGGWWLLLVGWSFCSAASGVAGRRKPLIRYAVKLQPESGCDPPACGSLMGVNMLPAAALFMMMSMNLMGAGGRRLFTVGMPAGVMSGDAALTGLPAIAMRSSSLKSRLCPSLCCIRFCSPGKLSNGH